LIEYSAATSLSTHPEHFAENIKRIVEPASCATRSPGCSTDRGVPVAIVSSSLIIVHQDLISFAEFLKFLFGGRIPRVFIRMVFYRQLAVGLLQVLDAGIALDPENFVIISFGSH
jgi:hypothetical protein